LAKKILVPPKMAVPELLETKIVGEPKYSRMNLDKKFREIDGSEAIFSIFGSSKWSVQVLAITEDGKVVMDWEYRRAPAQLILEVPGGVFDNIRFDVTKKDGGVVVSRRDIIETARRELRQEAGYRAKKFIILGGPIWFDPASWVSATFFVLALGCKKLPSQDLEKTEVIETFLVPFKRLPLVAREINDCKTLAIIYLATNYLRRRKLLID
jgi:ADP-ribose pyrophosphatase